MPDVHASRHAITPKSSSCLLNVRVAASPGSEGGCASLRSSQGGLPKRQSRVRRRPITASVGYSPSRDPSAAWPGQSGGHRTASSFHEYVCSVTPIFLTDSATVLPRPTSTSNSRSIGDDLLGQFFLSAWHGMPSFGCDTTRLSLWKWCRLRGAGQQRLVPPLGPVRSRNHLYSFPDFMRLTSSSPGKPKERTVPVGFFGK